MNQFLNRQYGSWNKVISQKQLSITIYASDKERGYGGAKKSKVQKGREQREVLPLQLQVNRFPIMRKKESKRKQIAEAFNKKPYSTPQPEHTLKHYYIPAPLQPNSSRISKKEEKV